MIKVKRVVIPDINEVRLVNELVDLCADWFKDVRFTHELSSDLDLTDDDKSAVPQVYKYFLPKREVPEVKANEVNLSANLPPGMAVDSIHAKAIQELVAENSIMEDPSAEFPCIIIRPGQMEIDLIDGEDFEEIAIDFHIFVSEHDKNERYEFVLLAKRIIVQGLRSISGGIVAHAFKLDRKISSTLFDDAQDPKAGVVVSTKWSCAAPKTTTRSLDEI